MASSLVKSPSLLSSQTAKALASRLAGVSSDPEFKKDVLDYRILMFLLLTSGAISRYNQACGAEIASVEQIDSKSQSKNFQKNIHDDSS